MTDEERFAAIASELHWASSGSVALDELRQQLAERDAQNEKMRATLRRALGAMQSAWYVLEPIKGEWDQFISQPDMDIRIAEVRAAIAPKAEPCKRCGGAGTVRVKHGLTFDTDSAEERALAYHNDVCPDCRGGK